MYGSCQSSIQTTRDCLVCLIHIIFKQVTRLTLLQESTSIAVTRSASACAIPTTTASSCLQKRSLTLCSTSSSEPSNPFHQLTKPRLSHNVFGPHDDKFHKLWEELRDEYEELAIKGFTGDAFLSEGQRLGGRNLPIQEMRRQARAAAQLRKQRKTGFSQRLGGAPVDARADIRSIIADAASRRMRITSRGDGCASNSQDAEAIGDEASQNGFRTEAEEKDANDRAISQALWELVQEEEARKAGVANWKDEGLQWNPSTGLQPALLPPALDEGQEEGKPKRGKSCDPPQSPPSKRHTRPVPRESGSSTASPSPPPKTKHLRTDDHKSMDVVDLTTSPSPPPPAPTTWSCEICTLVNPIQSPTCNACENDRPKSRSDSQPIKVKDEPARKPNRSDKLLLPRRSGALISAAEAEARAQLKPKAGWVCTRCGNWSEAMFWSCGQCGNIKERS